MWVIFATACGEIHNDKIKTTLSKHWNVIEPQHETNLMTWPISIFSLIVFYSTFLIKHPFFELEMRFLGLYLNRCVAFVIVFKFHIMLIYFFVCTLVNNMQIWISFAKRFHPHRYFNHIPCSYFSLHHSKCARQTIFAP